MKIMYLSAEVGPFVSVGGLSQVLYFLPRAASLQGDEVVVFTPKYGSMAETATSKKGWQFKDEMMGLAIPVSPNSDDEKLICNIKSYMDRKSRVKTYFLENREYYELRANVFGYKDDHVRFMLLCLGCLEYLLAQKKSGGWMPEVVQCNDWHTAYFAELARAWPRYKELMYKIPIALTIHNFTYQGNYEYRYCAPENKDDGIKPLLPLFSSDLVKQNPLLRGIIYADAVTTVSPTHAREVLTKEYGEGLEEVLTRERAKLSGILNGLDINEFDPMTDPLVVHNFGKSNYSRARSLNKKLLQEEFGLPLNKNAFLMAYSGRLSSQKGISILIEAMRHLLPENPQFQLIILGGGDDSYRRELTKLSELYPTQVGLHLMPNFKLPRKIFAGADSLLMPSTFEPGGIVALEALRYGAVPIVRRTGGLNDIIEDFEPSLKKGNGFSFKTKDAWALSGAVIRAATTYENTTLWNKLVANCLNSDFSWNDAAKQYRQWYKRTIVTRKRTIDLTPRTAYKPKLQITGEL